jgi:hypothetical protein
MISRILFPFVSHLHQPHAQGSYLEMLRNKGSSLDLKDSGWSTVRKTCACLAGHEEDSSTVSYAAALSKNGECSCLRALSDSIRQSGFQALHLFQVCFSTKYSFNFFCFLFLTDSRVLFPGRGLYPFLNYKTKFT